MTTGTLQFSQRARELAREHSVEASARYLRSRPHEDLFIVPSQTTDAVYEVSIHEDGICACTCIAGQHDRPCKHVGAALVALDAKRRQAQGDAAMDEALDAQYWQQVGAGAVGAVVPFSQYDHNDDWDW